MLMMQKMHQMMVRRQSAAPAVPAGFTAAEFERTSDKMEVIGGTAYGSNSGTILMSAWVNPDAYTDKETICYIASGDYTTQAGLNIDPTTGVFTFLAWDDTSSTYLEAFSDALGAAPFGWAHIAVKAVVNAGSGSRTVQMYVNGAEAFSHFDYDDGPGFTFPFTSMNAAGIAVGVYDFFDGKLAELYIGPGQSLDLSVGANLEKLITSGGEAEDLGADGSLVTGTAPLYYLRFSDNTNLGLNSGTGSDFTVSGTPTQVDGPNV